MITPETAAKIIDNGNHHHITRLMAEHPHLVRDHDVQQRLAATAYRNVYDHLLDHHPDHLTNYSKEIIAHHGNEKDRAKLAKIGNYTPLQANILAKHGNQEVHGELLKQKNLSRHALTMIADRGHMPHIDTIMQDHINTVQGDWGLKDAIYKGGSDRHRAQLKKMGWTP